MNSENTGWFAFITDNEFETLCGARAVEATKILGKYADNVCQACRGKCCESIGCGFHSAKFDSCPIYEYRPATCRLYHCEIILEDGLLSQEEQELLDEPVTIFSDSMWQGRGVEMLLEPQVKVGEKSWLALLGIEEEVHRIVQAFENGNIDSNLARTRLKNLVRRCRNQE